VHGLILRHFAILNIFRVDNIETSEKLYIAVVEILPAEPYAACRLKRYNLNKKYILMKKISLLSLSLWSLPGLLSAALSDTNPITNGDFEADLGSTVGSGVG